MLAISARACATSTFNEKQIADRIIAEFRKETSDKFAAGLTCANRVTAGDT
jgi:hypothetical protein